MRVKCLFEPMVRKAIIFFAKLILRLASESNLILTNDEYMTLEYLSDGDFSVFD